MGLSKATQQRKNLRSAGYKIAALFVDFPYPTRLLLPIRPLVGPFQGTLNVMTPRNRVAVLALTAWASATSLLYPQSASAQASAPPSEETRPATTTFLGDTGLWFVPTGEVLPHRKFSVSVYRVNFDRQEGFSDFSLWPVTVGVGIGHRVEVFGGFRVVDRIDRDIRPIFVPGNEAGGPVNDFPLVRQGWSGNKIGDFSVGAKFNILSERVQKPLALAVRGVVTLPTGDTDTGTSTGKASGLIDFIASKEVNQAAEIAGYVGAAFRGSPDEVELSNGLRYGFGVGVPSRRFLKITAELHGERYFDDFVTITGPLIADDLSEPSLISPIRSPLDFTLGATFQHRSGFFLGGGLSYALAHDNRADLYSLADNESGDKLGFQFRLGYHPGVGVYVAPVPPAPPPAPPAAPSNRPPTVKARCEPCTVEIGKSSTVSADAQDPDGDTLTYKWSAPTGTFANPNDRQTVWTAPNQPGPVQVTVTVDDGKGGTASDSVTIQVVRPAVKDFVFEDVHFDFDRYTLRPEATRILDEAIKALQENTNLRLQIEGHTCNIGTAEYNLALGERRASAVRDYLSSRGIGADRLSTVSYGEERPKHDNSREETRRLNRRGALVARVTQ